MVTLFIVISCILFVISCIFLVYFLINYLSYKGGNSDGVVKAFVFGFILGSIIVMVMAKVLLYFGLLVL